MEFTTKQELRNQVLNSDRFLIAFDCGLEFFRQYQAHRNEITRERNHDYKFIWHQYESDEKFINAVWNKIKRGGKISKSEIR